MGYLQFLLRLAAISFALLFLHLSVLVSDAKYITIETRVHTRLQRDRLAIGVELTNRGDEPAYNLLVKTEIGRDFQVGRAVKILKVDETVRKDLEFTVAFDKPGTYPVLVWIDFTDEKHYPFSFLSLTDFTYGKGGPPKIFARMEPLDIAKEGNLRLTVKNLDAKEKEVRVRLIVPKEISASDSLRDLRLMPLVEQDLSFAVSNISALVGADYTIYALAEYEDKERHYLASAAGSIKIIEKKRLTQTQAYLFVGIPLGMLVLYSLFVLTRKIRVRGHQP